VRTIRLGVGTAAAALAVPAPAPAPPAADLPLPPPTPRRLPLHAPHKGGPWRARRPVVVGGPAPAAPAAARLLLQEACPAAAHLPTSLQRPRYPCPRALRRRAPAPQRGRPLLSPPPPALGPLPTHTTTTAGPATGCRSTTPTTPPSATRRTPSCWCFPPTRCCSRTQASRPTPRGAAPAAIPERRSCALGSQHRGPHRRALCLGLSARCAAGCHAARRYAADQEAFFADYVAAHLKLSELGVEWAEGGPVKL
jgi:hypothetical protein